MFSNSSYNRTVRIDLFQAPPLPRYYVDRPEYSQDLKAYLLRNSSDTQAIVVTAIHGLGAVGKSTLATALAYDDEVQSRFSDGILWVTLGQEPNILPMLSGWVQALGDYNFKPTSVEATANHLRTSLYDKAVLLVVDDAWNTDHAKTFNLGGQRCQVLVTTREKAIADVLGAETYSLDVMTLSQSMQLLSQRLGCEITGEEAKQAEALVKKLRYLPLALELAAAQVEDGISWQVLLADIKRESRLKVKDGNVSWRVLLTDILQEMGLKIFDRPGTRDVTEEASLKQLSLTALLNSSIKRLTPKRRENFIWLGVLPDNVTITQRMTTVLWDMDDEGNARDELEYLRSQGFLLDGVPLADGKPTYRLNDLFHELARNLLTAPLKSRRRGGISGLSIGLTEAHGIFLEKYRRLTDNHLWHTLPNDGYIHQHLVWHLEKAGKIGEIHGLLAEESKSGANGWYETCQHLGKTGIFINDVARAWELTEVDWDESRLPQVVSLQCRYALITASINSLAAELPVDLLVPLMYSPEQALAYALQKSTRGDKVDYLAKLVDYLPEKLKKQALSEALAAALQTRSERERAQVIDALADKLKPKLLPEALTAALDIKKNKRKNHRNLVQVIDALADKLKPELLPEALAAARQIQDERYRAKFLIALADKLKPELLPEALAVARQIQDEIDRAEVISALANKLTAELLPEALAVALQIRSEEYRAQVTSTLANKLTPELLPQALAAALQIQTQYYRAQVLIALADKLTPELLPQALATALQIQDERYRAQFLITLANKLTPELLPQALTTALQIQNEYNRAQVFSALADKLTPELLPKALAAARKIQYGPSCAQVLIALADKLTSELLPEALAAARQILSESNSAQVLIPLVDKFPELLPEALAAARQILSDSNSAKVLIPLVDKFPELLPEVLATTRQIQSEHSRAQVLRALTDKLTPELLPEALATARQIQHESSRAQVFIALADKLTPELLPEALAAARQIQSERSRVQVLIALADKLTSELLPEALAAARQIQSKHSRAQVLIALADKLTSELLPEALAAARQILSESNNVQVIITLADKFPELLPEALAAARQIQSKHSRAEVIITLADKLTPELLTEALAAARQIQHKPNQARILSALADKFPELLPEALAAARQILNNRYRYHAQVIITLADKLTLELLPEALTAAQQIQDEYDRANVLNALADKLTQMPKTQLYPLWQDTLHTLSLRTRPDLLSDITALTPVIFYLGGEEAIKNTAITIQDVSRWWR
ncbi:MAG: hypothetical protein F6K39_03205 [Okeania sp. SIO3B3]|nr:hypothetical protein [Okeania sp. SIO3B3]